MPAVWTAAIQRASDMKQPHQSLRDLLDTAPPTPEAWYRQGDRAGPAGTDATITLSHHVDPIGVLRIALHPATAPATSCTQIHVWQHQNLAHSDAQRQARERALARGERDPFPTTLLTSGAVAEGPLLGLPPTPFPVGANPAHFCLASEATDRMQQPIPLHKVDVHHIYRAQLSAFYSPVRTLDPNHTPTTATSTSWPLDDPDATPQQVRLDLVRGPMQAGLPAHMQETQFMVRNDALHVGDRCVKKGCTKGICDLCYVLLGTRAPETTLHIVRDCPFTRPVTTAVWRAGFLPRAQPHTHQAALNMTTDEFCTTFTRRMVLGVAKYDPPAFRTAGALSTPIAALAAATNTVLIRRRNNNALNTRCPLQHDTAAAVGHVFRQIRDMATATYREAVREEDRIYTSYEGWLPDEDDLPTTEWTNAWINSRLLRFPNPYAALDFPLPAPTAAGVEPGPVYDANDPAVLARSQSRVSY